MSRGNFKLKFSNSIKLLKDIKKKTLKPFKNSETLNRI